MFSYSSPDERVRKEHPLRAIRNMVDRALREMSPLFDEMYSEIGRPSIAPEKLLRTVATDAVFGTQRALVAGRDRLQCAAPLVRGNEHGRGGMGRDGVHEESRSPAGARSGESILHPGMAAGRTGEADLG